MLPEWESPRETTVREHFEWFASEAEKDLKKHNKADAFNTTKRLGFKA